MPKPKKPKQKTKTSDDKLGPVVASPKEEKQEETNKKKKHRNPFNRFELTPPKFAVNDAPLTPRTRKVFREELTKNNPDIRSVIIDEKGNPTTPKGKTPLTQVGELGGLPLYDSRPKEKKPARAAKKMSSSAAILKALSTDLDESKLEMTTQQQKIKKATITKKSLQEVIKEKTKYSGRRNPSQNQAMEMTAKAAAEKYGYDTENRQWEWGHLIGKRFLKMNEAQNSDNLVLMTKECNTMMMALEDEIFNFVNKLKDETIEIKLKVISDLNPKTHLATNIKYKVKCDVLNLDLPLSFDPLSTYKPQNPVKDVAKTEFNTALRIGKPFTYVSAPESKSDKDAKNQEANFKRTTRSVTKASAEKAIAESPKGKPLVLR